MTVSGYLGFLILKPISLEISSFKDNLPASTNCIMAVEEKDLDIDAILKMSVSDNGILFSLSFKPKECV
ncbi:hypothetical protein D3C87_1731000 [compost metagenome]